MAKIKKKSKQKNMVYETKIPPIGQRELEMLKEARRLLRENDNYIFGCFRRKR